MQLWIRVFESEEIPLKRLTVTFRTIKMYLKSRPPLGVAQKGQ